VKIAQLPVDATVLTFKTLVTYTNGDVDRWIGAAADSNPAPFVSLTPAASPTVASPSPSAVATTAASSPSAVTATATAAGGTSSSAGWIVAAVVAAALLILGVVVWLARRGRNRSAA
jgi:hypothetical protein